uniref:uncharacterized protein LOC122601246 n=1 Tax=Erigeron canadensis TaxID=72917 RepID=UPI001CB9A372|nr:uncharacterized protein LOC122601246 [Erigeron canadensis]
METALLVKGAVGRDRLGGNIGAGGLGSGRCDARRNDKRFDHRDTRRREERRDDRRDDRREKRGGPYDRIVNLIKSPREILKTERVGGNFKPPRPMIHRTGKKDMSKYCEFHEDRGHETNACRELKIEIKRALDEGKLEHLVPGAKQGKRVTQAKKTYTWQKQDERNDRPPPPDGHVYMIREKHKYEKRKAEVLEPWRMVSISFLPVEAVSSDPVVTQAIVANFEIRKVYLDNGSSSDITYDHCFQKLPQRIKDLKRPSRTELVSFMGESNRPVGEISMEVMMGEYPFHRIELVDFMIIRAPSFYNVILGRPLMKKFGSIPSTVHGIVKFPTPARVATIRGRMTSPEECKQVEKTLPRKVEKVQDKKQDCHEEKVIINKKFPDQPVIIGSQLPRRIKEELIHLLKNNLDVIAWQTSDMIGVPRELAKHALNANPNISPIRQKKRGMSQDRSKAACEQVNEMVKAGILREVKYQTWVANPVMVKKPDGSWRLCVDFKDINKVCPKDNYPLPEIDWKVESLDGFRLKCFLDAYKGYHQISMKKMDEDKTAFHTDQGLYCFEKMPFVLKNVGATYQRLIDKAFKDQIGRNVEAYVDDIVIKSRAEEIMLADVQETFDTLRSINMKLNPSKCSFGMEEGKFLGHIITPNGIKANPKKIQAVLDMASPRTKKQVQSFNGKLAALARFLSKSAERSLPFFRTLKGCLRKQDFSWSAEAEEAFKDMKKFLADLPTLTAPIAGETLTLYLAASKECVSAVLLAERNNGQMPMYFVSRALKGPKINYPCLEKLALALVHAARRLRRYFQGHPFRVLTDKPIRQVLAKPEVSRRLAKWAIEQGKHEISFHPRTSTKGQILADFLAETDSSDVTGKGKEVQEVQATQEKESSKWTLFTDGASNQEGSGAGLILIDPEEREYTYALRFNFPASNNEAEYEALLAGLRMAKQMGVKKIQVFVDSQQVANQINGTFEANQPSMQLYLEETKKLIGEFESFHIEQVRRNQNKKADALSKLASLTFAHLTKEVLVEVLQEKSIAKGSEVSQVEEEEDCWMTSI